jgi:hypothetical protein
MNGMPTVPVHDLKIHPRDRELIATNTRSTDRRHRAAAAGESEAVVTEPVLLETSRGFSSAVHP